MANTFETDRYRSSERGTGPRRSNWLPWALGAVLLALLGLWALSRGRHDVEQRMEHQVPTEMNRPAPEQPGTR